MLFRFVYDGQENLEETNQEQDYKSFYEFFHEEQNRADYCYDKPPDRQVEGRILT